MATVDCFTRFGIASAASPVAWAGGGSGRSVSDWLPRIDEPAIVLKDGKYYWTPRWYNFQRAIADRLGGVQGPSIKQIQATTVQVQAQVAENTNYAVQVADYAAQVAETARATAEVATNNSLTGAPSIPDTGDPPPRPGRQPV